MHSPHAIARERIASSDNRVSLRQRENPPVGLAARVLKSHFHASTGLCCTHFLGSHVAQAPSMSPLDIAAFAAHLFHHCHLFPAFRYGSRCRNGLGHILARICHHGSSSWGCGDGGCQKGSHRKNQAFRSNLPGKRRPFGSPKMNCCKFGFEEHYPRPSHSWLFTLLFTCSEDVLVLHLCKKPLIGGTANQM
jgi:hypothetical protein